MAEQFDVAKSCDTTYVGDTFPTTANVGESLLYTGSNPLSLFTFCGGRWIFLGYLRSLQDADKGTAGYVAGGSLTSTLEKMSFTSETFSTIASNLWRVSSGEAGTQSGTNGYVAGGAQGSYASATTVIDRLVFSSDAVASITSGMSAARSILFAVESAINGYFAGGYDTASTPLSLLDRLVFSSNAVASMSTALTEAHAYNNGMATSTNGYVGGGVSPGNTKVCKLTFSSETTALISTQLEASLVVVSAAGATFDFGYWMGGSGSGAGSTKVTRIAFSTETVGTMASGLPTAQDETNGFQSRAALYCPCGYTTGLGTNKVNQSLTFVTEVTKTLSGQLVGSGKVNFGCFENLTV